MHKTRLVVFFWLGEQRFALPLAMVERVVRVVEITPLPKAPDIVLGIINLQGRVVPVVNIRKRFNLPERDIQLSDQLVIAKAAKRTFALLVDTVSGVLECEDERWVSGETILPHMQYIDGAIKTEDGLILLHDLNRFLSLEEERTLDEAL